MIGQTTISVKSQENTIQELKKKNQHTSSDQSKLVFLISNFFLLNISPREEKSHHPFEELVHELNSQGHHIYLKIKKFYSLV